MPDRSRSLVVAVALGFTSWEPEFVAALGHPSAGIQVARRCLDCADLLAFAATSRVDVFIVNSQLEQLDLEVISELRAHGAAVLVLTADVEEQQRLSGLGADRVLFVSAERVAASARAVASVVRDICQPNQLTSRAASAETESAGRVLSVWGPAGSTGRSTVALSVADELARVGHSCALVDADQVAPCLDQLLGVGDGAGSLDWALRHAAHGDLNRRELLARMPMSRTGVRLLVSSAAGSVLRPHLWSRVCDELQQSVEATVCDLGVLDTFPGVGVDEISSSPARAATLETIRRSSVRIVVGSADLVGLARLMRHLSAVEEAGLLSDARCFVVLSRLSQDDVATLQFIEKHLVPRAGAVGAHVLALDDDARACRAARARACTLAEVAPKSRLRRDLRHLAELVAA